jgi:hypothetical protein
LRDHVHTYTAPNEKEFQIIWKDCYLPKLFRDSTPSLTSFFSRHILNLCQTRMGEADEGPQCTAPISVAVLYVINTRLKDAILSRDHDLS